MEVGSKRTKIKIAATQVVEPFMSLASFMISLLAFFSISFDFILEDCKHITEQVTERDLITMVVKIGGRRR